MRFEDLIELETHNRLWGFKFKGYPVWYIIRSRLLDDQVPTPSRLTKQMFVNVCLPDLFNLREKRTLVSVVNRPELMSLVEFLNRNKECLNIIRFESNYSNKIKACSSLPWDFTRAIFRKCSWIFYRQEVKNLTRLVGDIKYHPDTERLLKLLIGDISYLHFLKVFFLKRFETVYHTNGIIPDISKFDSDIQFVEIQHGHISNNHPGYIGVPGIKGKLLCWDEATSRRLKQLKFSGELDVVKLPNHTKTGMNVKNVIFATVGSEKLVSKFVTDSKYENYIVKLHPKSQVVKIVGTTHDFINFDTIENAIVIGTSTVIKNLSLSPSCLSITVIPFFQREKIKTLNEFRDLVLEEFPEIIENGKALHIRNEI